MLVPLLRWVLLVAALSAIGAPVAARLFERFPDRGASFALPVALAVAFLPMYWVGKLNATAGFAAGVLAAFVAGAVALRFGSRPDWRAARAPAAVFLVAFLALLVVRLGYPAIVAAGGEKFLDFSLLNAVLRAETFPPEDPWFAGEPVRYYYGGYLVSGFLTELSGVEPRYAYNLLLPTFYAALATGAYGLGRAVAAREGGSGHLAGVAAAFLVAAAGNLATPVRFLLGLLPDPLARWVGEPFVAGIRASYTDALAAATNPSAWSYWLGRYVIPGTPDVFPAWTFVNGDLRPHMTGVPFLVLAAALAFAYYRTPADEAWRRRLLLFGALPALGGVLAVTNTWALPVVVGLTFLTVALAPADPRGLFGPLADRLPGDVGPVRREAWRVVAGAGCALVVGALAAAAVAPYFLFHTATSDGVGFLPPGSPLVPFLLVHGGFLTLFALFLAGPTGRAVREHPRRALPPVAVGAALLGLLAGVGFAPVALLVGFGAAAWVAARRDAGFGAVLVLAGVGLVCFAELAYAKVWPHDPNALRWNTVYKIYHSVWALWGVAGGVAAGTVLPAAVRRLRREGRIRDRLRPAGTLLLVCAVLVGMATFPVFAGGERVTAAASGPTTLNGLDYVNDTRPDAGAAIAWLDSREGNPTIASAPGRTTYSWVNAPSSLTGVPTVVGWVHQKGYRGEEAYERRASDVRLLFEGGVNTTFATAEKYDVEYVYVGENERERYDLGPFTDDERIEVAFESGDVVVYELRR